MTRLVDDLLDAGRLNTGKITLKIAQLDYTETVTKCIEAVRPFLDARRHRISTDMPARRVMLEGDATRLSQVLQNLLINAAKFTPEGGEILLTAWLDGAHLYTTVADNGVGITADSLDAIFTLFSQVESAAAGQSGLGIGLTLAKSLVELHGGTLHASSAGLGLGSTFTFVLPGAHLAAEEEQNAGDFKKRLMVCDDNRDSADSMAEVLRMLGFHVVTAYDSVGAEKAVRATQPNAVFLDLSMPDTTGFELLKKLHQIPGQQHMQAFAVTGYGNEEDKRRTKAAGFADHLTKPVELGRLREALEQAKLM